MPKIKIFYREVNYVHLALNVSPSVLLTIVAKDSKYFMIIFMMHLLVSCITNILVYSLVLYALPEILSDFVLNVYVYCCSS